MEENPASRQIDQVLIPFLPIMVEQAGPVIREIIGYKQRTFFDRENLTLQEAEDIRSNVLLNLITRLRAPAGDGQEGSRFTIEGAYL